MTRRIGKRERATPGGVDLYVGGTEHAVLHLLYARFWHKVLFDLGHVSTPEPFQRLVNQGMILGEDGHKMSKRWGNVIDPLDVIANLRRRRVSLLRDVHGPARADEAVEHERRGRRLALPRPRLAPDHGGKPGRRMDPLRRRAGREPTKPQQKVCTPRSRKSAKTSKRSRFNTAISQMMIFVNAFTNGRRPGPSPRCARCSCPAQSVRAASHLGALGNAGREIPGSSRPTSPSNPGRLTIADFLVEDEIEIVLQVNGKVRDRIMVPIDATKAELEAIALANERVREFTAGQDNSQGRGGTRISLSTSSRPRMIGYHA